MLILPAGNTRHTQMLVIVTATVLVGGLVATVIRWRLGISLAVPLVMGGAVGPALVLLWVWHWRRWPYVGWVETALYACMAVAAQWVMEVNVTGALFVIPVIGVMHRHRGLTVFAASLSAIGYGVLLVAGAPPLHSGMPALQFGAHLVLQATLAAVFTELISLAKQAERSHQQARMTEQVALQWAVSIEARDPYTGGHVERVTRYAAELAPFIHSLGMDLATFRLACMLHDVGKVAVPDEVLNKRGALTPEERHCMEAHTVNGYHMVLRTNIPVVVAAVVRHHHERWDGNGYPDALSGEEIPPAARVLAVADAYDAMTSDRPYRAALTPQQARERIWAGSGTQFDPAVVAAFDRVWSRWAGTERPGSYTGIGTELSESTQ